MGLIRKERKLINNLLKNNGLYIINDPYNLKDIFAIARFKLYLEDAVSDLKKNLDNPDYIVSSSAYTAYYINICFRQKSKSDKSLNKKDVKMIQDLIICRNCSLLECYEVLLQLLK